jgi:glucose/arabinose dehydrogenase
MRRLRSIVAIEVAAVAMLAVAFPRMSFAEIPKGDIIIRLETVASGLTAPLGVTHAGDGSGRLFIVEQSGQIRIVQGGELLPTPFLDLSGEIPALNAFFDERGLLGLAFHPEYATNGRVFVRYSKPRAGAPSEPCFGTSRGCHEEVLAEFGVSEDDPNVADPAGAILFRIDEPQFNHDAGEVAFGPDGFLYFTLGDGGGAHDGLADTPPSHGPIGHGQNIETALGAILRIDVDRPPQAPLAYAIPPDNPFVGGPGLDETYAYGLRNPYKFSFDDGPGGDGTLFLADVGQNLIEEVDIIVNGGNYGWVIKEGFSCFDPFNPNDPPDSCSDTGPSGEPLIDPIVDYTHEEGGITVIGGFVYRGSRSPSLVGTYVFGDFTEVFVVPTGRLYFLEEATPGDFEILQFRIGTEDVPYGLFLKGFGEDEDGELYACGSTALAPFGATGRVERIVVETVVIDGCDTGVPEVSLDGGSSIGDLIAECADGARNNGKFVSCVAKLTKVLKKDGIIAGREKGAIQSCAARASVP